jgi:hypothetical protein
MCLLQYWVLQKNSHRPKVSKRAISPWTPPASMLLPSTSHWLKQEWQSFWRLCQALLSHNIESGGNGCLAVLARIQVVWLFFEELGNGSIHVYIYTHLVQRRPAPPMGQSCFLAFPPPPVACGGGAFGALVMGGQSWFLWLVVCMWCMYVCM